MKTIAYIVPYFGSFPNLFPLWLNSCRYNPTVDWLIFTDDKREFNYPENVHVYYMSFEEMKKLVQGNFEYNIWLERPYKLCDFKIAYGDLFHDYLKAYDFWGFCDIDLIWGDIRHFLTKEILNKYDKIGFQGHSTLIKNTDFYIYLYKHGLNDGTSYQRIAQSENNCISDEKYYNRLFCELNIPFYQEFTFANLSPFVWNFRLNYIENDQKVKNKNFIFEYIKGKLNRVATCGNEVFRDQYMYVHFLKREIEVNVNIESDAFLIVPNKIIAVESLDAKKICNYNKPHYLKYFFSHIKDNLYKLKWNTFIPIICTKIRGYYRLFFNSNKVRF